MDKEKQEGIEKYLAMQKTFYDVEAQKWTVDNRDPVVGSFDAHNRFQPYDDVLFDGLDTKPMVALEYGCGPGRNLVRYHSRFKRIDATDISQYNLDKAAKWCEHNQVTPGNLKVCDGQSIPFNDAEYDMVFSVICLQHICVHSIRFSIFKDAYRVLRPEGHFCFQMGYGGRNMTSAYYENASDATLTNGGMDVAVEDADGLAKDLEDEIGFKGFKHKLTDLGPGDTHKQWIWVQVQK